MDRTEYGFFSKHGSGVCVLAEFQDIPRLAVQGAAQGRQGGETHRLGLSRLEDGKTATSNFISGMMGSVPPLQELFKMAGMTLPSFLQGEAPKADEQPAAEEKAE